MRGLVAFTGLATGYTAGISDWRLPDTPLEAGRVCGSGCGYDIASPEWEAEPARFAGVWVGLAFGAFQPHPPRRSMVYWKGVGRLQIPNQPW